MCRFCFREAMLQMKEMIDCRSKTVEARLDIFLAEIIRQIRDNYERRK